MMEKIRESTDGTDLRVAPPLLKVRGITKSYPKTGGGKSEGGDAQNILLDVSFDLRSGSLMSIVGPSGCGKTTLLRIVDGLVQPDSGEVILEGKQVTSPPAKMSFVFQQFGLMPWRSVLKNVEFGLELRGVGPEARRKTAQEYVRIVGLAGFENHYVTQISGGMQQRVGLARALAVDPDVLLMDEPFASIDEQMREILQRQLLQIVKGTTPKTTLFVTHNVDEAIALSDEILLLSLRPGRVKEVIKVNLPPDRWSYDLRSEPEYVRLRRRIWDFLEAEIMEKGGFGTRGSERR
jgi:NitT/TauT family transport system ATP-binding protein